MSLHLNEGYFTDEEVKFLCMGKFWEPLGIWRFCMYYSAEAGEYTAILIGKLKKCSYCP